MMRLVLFIVITGLLSCGRQEESAKSGIEVTSEKPVAAASDELGKKIENQSFEVELPGFGLVEFCSYWYPASKPLSLKFYLFKNDKVVYELPEYSNNVNPGVSLEAVAFRDLNDDGNKDIVVISEHVTGIGPQGSVPFVNVGVYLYDSYSFTENEQLNTEIGINTLFTVDEITKYFERKKGTNK